MSKIFNISSLDKSLGRIFSDFRNSNFKAHLLSLVEQIWELIWKFHLKSIVWHIKIDSYKGYQMWNAEYSYNRQLPKPSFEFLTYYLNVSLMVYEKDLFWYIKTDHFHEPPMIHGGSMSKMNVFKVVCCNCTQRFTSGSLYTSSKIGV